MGLLKNLDPLLTADLLYVLRQMGHCDKLVVCDCNFPAYEVAQTTVTQKLIELPGCDNIELLLKAIASVLPLDHFRHEGPVSIMGPGDGDGPLPPLGVQVHERMLENIFPVSPVDRSYKGWEKIERGSFYMASRQRCFAVVQCGERRPYANCIIHKGCIGVDGEEMRPRD